MNKFARPAARRTGIGAIILLLLALYAPSLQAEEVELTTGPDYPPFADPKLADGGVATRIVVTVFRQMGLAPVVDWLPWRRGYKLTKQGVYLASFPYLRTAERERDFLYSERIYSDDSYLWTRVNDRIIGKAGERLVADEAASFKGRTICVPEGYSTPLASFLQQMTDRHEINVESPRSLDQCVTMLASGRVDAFSGQISEIEPSIQAQGLQSKILRSKMIAKLDYFVVFTRNDDRSAELLRQFNQTLAGMKRDGSYDSLAENFR